MLQDETNAAIAAIVGGAGGMSASATATVQQPEQPQERPDANHHLKVDHFGSSVGQGAKTVCYIFIFPYLQFTYGVNAWKHWVVQKNSEIEQMREEGKYLKPFETDILKLRCDELSYTLCMFVKEVKKPNGEQYAPDSVLYLALGIQEYLFENGRMENIFADIYYEPFTSALHEVVKDFKLPVNELGYFVTRIEEEHMWEAKLVGKVVRVILLPLRSFVFHARTYFFFQLGAHSPQVLLNTLVYFNTKYFMLKSLEHHTDLSFAHVVEHWQYADGTSSWTSGRSHTPQSADKKALILRYSPPVSKGGSRSKTRAA